jgi:hypothetical protein
MKNCILLLMFACLSISYLQAQSFKYGVKAGLNVSNLAISPELDPPSPSAKIGVHLGGFAQIGLVGNFSVQPEISFSTQGANDEDKDDWQRVKLSYINLAAPFKYTLGNNLHLSIGPQVGFLSGGEFEKEDKADGERKLQNARHVLAGTDLAIGFGLGYTLPSGIDLHLRYNYGLTELNNDPADLGFYEPLQSIKSRVLQVSVGYIFNY